MKHIIITGPPASGKTRLAEKIARAVTSVLRTAFVYPNNTHFINSIITESLDAADLLENVDCVVVDELRHIEKATQLSKAKLMQGKVLIVITQKPITLFEANCEDFEVIELPIPDSDKKVYAHHNFKPA